MPLLLWFSLTAKHIINATFSGKRYLIMADPKSQNSIN